VALPGNLLSENAEGIETDASAWTTGSGTFERDTSRAHSGVASLRLTSAGPGDTWVYSNGDLTGLTPGTTYTVYVWAYTTISGLVAQVGLDWRNSSGTYLSSYASPSVPLVPNQWTQVGPFQTTAPANAARATLYLAWFTATAAGQTVWFDDIYLGIPPAVTTKDLAETGAGGETLVVARTIGLADAGAGVDALSAVVAVPLADAGAAADTFGVTALVEVVEAGAGVEAPAAAATVPLGEAGAGVGVLDALPGPDLGEAGEASDALGVAASTVLGDAGAATEGVDVARLIGLVDTGAAADALLAGEVVEHLLADAGAAADALGVAAAVELADAGAGVEVAAVDVLVPLVEAAAGVDAVTSGVQVLLGDAAAGVDALGVAATRNIGPAGRPRRRWEIAAPLGWVFRGPRTRRARR